MVYYKLIMAACLLLLSTAPLATDVYKCTYDGFVTFSAKPCAEAEQQSIYDTLRGEPLIDYQEKQKKKLIDKLNARLEKAQQYVHRYPRLNDKIKQAILNCDITQGMTRKQVALAWDIEPSSERRQVNAKSSLTFVTYNKTPLCRKDKFIEADLTFSNRSQLLVGWNIRS